MNCIAVLYYLFRLLLNTCAHIEAYFVLKDFFNNCELFIDVMLNNTLVNIQDITISHNYRLNFVKKISHLILFQKVVCCY